MPVVIDADDLLLKDVFQFLEVDNKSRNRIYVTRHGNFECVIVTMTIAVRTSAEDAQVLLRRPRFIPVVVSGRKLGFAGYKDHERVPIIGCYSRSGGYRAELLDSCIVRASLPCDVLLNAVMNDA